MKGAEISLPSSPIRPSRFLRKTMAIGSIVAGLLLSSCGKNESSGESKSVKKPDTVEPATTPKLTLEGMPGRIAAQKKGELPLENARQLTENEYLALVEEYKRNQQAGYYEDAEGRNMGGLVISHSDVVEMTRLSRYVIARMLKAVTPRIGSILSQPPKDRDALNQWTFEVLKKLLADQTFLDAMKQAFNSDMTNIIDCQERASIYAVIWQAGNTYLERNSQNQNDTRVQFVSGILHARVCPDGAGHMWVETMRNGVHTILDPSVLTNGQLTVIQGENNGHVAIGAFEVTGTWSTQNGKSIFDTSGTSASRRKEF